MNETGIKVSGRREREREISVEEKGTAVEDNCKVRHVSVYKTGKKKG